MAKWAIARRVDGLTNDILDEALAAGRLLRTHVLRPTWHFVLPEDLGWIMGLTAPRVHRLMAGHNKTVALFHPELDAAAGITVAALVDGPMTRARVAEHLVEAGIDARGIRLAHLLIHAELEMLVVNGPLAGNQHTYQLAPAIVRDAAPLTQDEALERLARTYVRGHGPSRPADLTWWSSLTTTQSRKAFELADLRPVSIDGQDYWTDDTAQVAEPPVAALVPPFDESISYVDKPIDRVRFPSARPDLARGGGLLFVDGVIGGTWNRKTRAHSVQIEVDPYEPLSKAERLATEADAARFGTFLGIDVTCRFVG